MAPPIIALGSTPAPVAENDETVSVTIVRTGEDLSGTSSIKYSTKRSDATPGQDYTETIGTAIFAPYETTKTITVPILNDLDAEPDENFTFDKFQISGGMGRKARPIILHNTFVCKFPNLF